jgi:hypothetical protein
MRIGALILMSMAASVSTCDLAWSQTPKPPYANDQNASGRWAILPVYSGPIDVGGTPHYFAWRLDTLTGSLEMCSYDPGSWKKITAPEGVATEQIACSKSVPASGK